MMGREFGRALQELEQQKDEGTPGDWVVHQWRGRALLRTGRYEQAETELRKAVSMRGAYPGLALSLSEALYMQGRFPEANRYKTREAFLLLPINPRGSMHLFAEVLMHGTIYKLATASRKLEQLLPEHSTILRFLTRVVPPYEPYATLSEMAFTQGHMKEAYDLLQRALKFATNEARLWGNLSAVCMGLGRTDEAESACTRARALDPNNPRWEEQEKSIKAVASGSEQLRLFTVTQRKGKDGRPTTVEVERVTER
jgi:Flp pilus assembly protein TadD